MAFVIGDRVRETSTTTGTGSFTLAGAVTGYQTFDTVLDTSDTTYYTIADQSGANFEVGIGTFTAPATLARTTILSSSNGGSAVNFGAGTKDVFISLPASKTVQSFSAGSTGLTPSTASFGAVSLAGTLVAANGGTGQSSYTIGDLLYASGATALSKLADIATGNALISGGVATAPSWGKIGLTTHVSGTLPVTNGGTGTATAFTAGSVVFAGASGVYAQDNTNLFFDDTNNRLGIGTATPAVKLAISSTDAVLVPVGTTAQRPTGATGYLRFNSTTTSFEGYNGSNWGSIGDNGPAFSAALTVNQTITSSTFTKVQLNSELFDTNSNFDPTTNYRFTPTVSGYYQIGWAVSGFASTSATRNLSTLYKNGTPYAYGNDHVATAGIGTSVGSVVVFMNGSTDYLELYGLITATTAIISTSGGASIYTYMSGALVRSA